MSKSPRPLVAGNWKNNGTIAMGETLAREVVAGAGNSPAEIVL